MVARAAWWGAPDDTAPIALDWFDFAPREEEAGAELPRRAPFRSEHSLLVPPGWREAPEVRAAAESRIAAARAAGVEVLVERFRYVWTTDCPLPERPGRLTFRPEPGDAVILDVLRRVHPVTLDAHARRDIEGPGGLDAAARSELPSRARRTARTRRWRPRSPAPVTPSLRSASTWCSLRVE